MTPAERDRVIELEGVIRTALEDRRRRIAEAESLLGPMPPGVAKIMARANLADEVLLRQAYEVTGGETLG